MAYVFEEPSFKKATEKIDTNFLDLTLKKEMHLYHGTFKQGLTVIEPNSWNMGNRLSPMKKKCSFWTNNFDYAVIWALDWVLYAMDFYQYVHNIERKKFLVSKTGEFTNKKTGEKKSVKEFMLMDLDHLPVYVYEATIPTKHIGRGQLNIEEYTVDIPVDVEKVTPITSKIAEKYIEEIPFPVLDNYLSKGYGTRKKDKTTLRELLIFRSPSKILRKRRATYLKEALKAEKEKNKMAKANPVTESVMFFDDLLDFSDCDE